MTKNKHVIRSDLKKSDAYVIAAREYEEAPELFDRQLDIALFEVGSRVVQRGRPKSDAPKKAVNLRLDPDVLAQFRATGAGWQTRINEALRRSLKLGKMTTRHFDKSISITAGSPMKNRRFKRRRQAVKSVQQKRA